MKEDASDYSRELECFSLIGATTYPNLPEPRLFDGMYHVYEGAIGPNRYQYFQVPQGSEAWEALVVFIDRYYMQQVHRVNYYEEGMALLELVKRDATVHLEGEPAFDKFWKEWLNSEEKLALPFYLIPFFNPLVEWFSYRHIRYFTETNKENVSDAALLANGKRWVRDLHRQVANYIEAAKMTDRRNFSTISADQARELLRFRDWLQTSLDDGSKPPTLADFIVDFETKDRKLDKTSSDEKGDVKISYVMNKRRYSVIQFWILFKDYHVEKAMEFTDYAERLNYFERILPKLQVESNRDYERFILNLAVPAEIAEEVHVRAKRVIEEIEHLILDLRRFFREQDRTNGPFKKTTNKEWPEIPWIGKLMQHLIPNPILNAYFGMTWQPRDESEAPEGYLGNIKHFIQPFVTVADGVYVLRSFLELLQIKVRDGYYREKQVSDESIGEHLSIYSKGFIEGYHTFDNDYLKEKLGLFTQQADIEEFVYRQVTDIFSSHGNFSETIGGGRHLLSDWHSNGIDGGRFYRAWYIILEHWQHFESKFAATDAQPEVTKAEKPFTDADMVERIIRSILHAGKMALLASDLYENKDEDELRNIFLFGLNNSNLSPITVTGETYNRDGKTDMCFKKTNGETIFVAECKVWRGSGNMLAAVEQLIGRYVHWPLTRSAVLLFVKIPSFTKVCEAIKENLCRSKYFINWLPSRSESHFTAVFRQANDPDRHVQLEIIAFPFPASVAD